MVVFLSVQFSRSVISDSLQPHGLQHRQASLSITNSWSLLKLMSIELVMPYNHLITLPKKVCLFKAMVFPVVMCGCESWTIKKAEC